MFSCALQVFVKMPPRMKTAVNRPSKRGRSTTASSSRRTRSPSPSSSQSTSPSLTPRSSPSPPPQPGSAVLKPNAQMLAALKTRSIMVERRTLRNVVNPHESAAILAQVGWENILDWGDKAYPSLVFGMFASITAAVSSVDSCSFTIAFQNKVVTVDPDRISSIMNVPVNPNGLSMVSDTLTEAEKDQATIVLCGHSVKWNPKNFLPLGSLIPKYRLLHHLFTFNVYPRKGNRTELTAYMVNVLSKVVTGVQMCLPSLICRTIVRFHLSTASKPAIPFGFLLSQIARSLGILRPNEPPIFHAPFGPTNLTQMNLFPNEEAGDVPPHPQPQAPLAPQHQAPSGLAPSSSHRQDSSSSVPRSIEERMDAFERNQSKTEKLLKKTLKYLSGLSKACRTQDATIMPPSPSPSSD